MLTLSSYHNATLPLMLPLSIFTAHAATMPRYAGMARHYVAAAIYALALLPLPFFRFRLLLPFRCFCFFITMLLPCRLFHAAIISFAIFIHADAAHFLSLLPPAPYHHC